MRLITSLLGYPRIGVNRQLKVALENVWAGKISQEELLNVSAQLRADHWKAQKQAGIDILPCNDFSLYDTVLDTAMMVGAVPQRYTHLEDLDAYFAMARGAAELKLPALAMKKWFNTNYHYIVPEIEEQTKFKLNISKIKLELEQAKKEALRPQVVILGPVTFFNLCLNSPLHRLSELLKVYEVNWFPICRHSDRLKDIGGVYD